MIRRLVRTVGLPVSPPTERKPQVTVEYDPRKRAKAELTALSGIGEKRAQRLIDAGITSQEALAAADSAKLAEETGLSERRLTRWIEAAMDD